MSSDGKLSPFDFIAAASQTKEDLFADNEERSVEETEKMYSPFMVNRGFSYFPDSILHANEMNRLPDIPKKEQFAYYSVVLRRAKRFSKWAKASTDEDVKLVQRVFACNPKVARDHLRVLRPQDLEDMRASEQLGG